MTPEEVFDRCRATLVGLRVTDRQLAANSMSVWIATSDDPHAGFIIGFDPSWHVVGPTGVITGSGQASDRKDPTGWKAVADLIDVLIGRQVVDLIRDPATGDIELRLSDGYRISSFVNDPRDESSWYVRILATDEWLHSGPKGLSLSEDA